MTHKGHTGTTEPRTDLLLEFLLASLAPLLMVGGIADFPSARRAARQAIDAYNASSQVELVTIAQTLGFALTALDDLRLSLAANLPLTMKLRLRGNAIALGRSSRHSSETLEKFRRTVARSGPSLAEQAAYGPAQAPGTRPDHPNPVTAELPAELRSDPVTAEPCPAGLRSDPVTAETCPDEPRPDPVTAEPCPDEPRPDLVTAEPCPAEPRPDPVTAELRPAEPRPEAVTAEPCPAEPRPDPVTAETCPDPLQAAPAASTRQQWAHAMTTVAAELQARVAHVSPLQLHSDGLWVDVLTDLATELHHPAAPIPCRKADLLRTTLMAQGRQYPPQPANAPTPKPTRQNRGT
jgi:hypothetical protein